MQEEHSGGPHSSARDHHQADRQGGRQFPLTDVANFLQSAGAGIEAERHGFAWSPLASGRASFSVIPLHRRTHDGYLVTEQAEWVLRAPWMTGADAAAANAWNQFASVAGFARDPGSGELVLTSKVGIYEGNEAAALRNYAPIMATSAAGLGWIAERFAWSDFDVSPQDCPFHGVDDPPPLVRPGRPVDP